QVQVFELRRGRKKDVGVIGGVGLEMFEHYRKQVVSLQPRQYALLIGRDRAGIAVVDDQCAHGRIRRRERLAQLTHVYGAWFALDEIGPLQGGVVVFENPACAEDGAAAWTPPRADERGQAEDVANRHSAAGMALQSVIDADEGWGTRRVFVSEALD